MRSALLITLTLTAFPLRADLGPQIDARLHELEGRGFSGAVLVASRGRVVMSKAYGLANRERKIVNTSETLFNVASVAKTFTATAILQLESGGLLRTEDLVSKYIGAFPEGENGATIHHLLTHTSGLVKKGTELDYASREAFIRSVKNAPRAAKPGAEYVYLNAGYSLLAAIVEIVSGATIEQYLQTNIFDPAHMCSTGFVWDRRFASAPVAIGYRGKTIEELKPEAPVPNDWARRGAQGVLTTTGDLHKFVEALNGHTLLSPAATKKMFTAYSGDEGYGWHVNKTARGTSVVHRGGGLPHVSAEVRWYRDEEAWIILLMNNALGFRAPAYQAIEKILWP